MPRMKKHGKGRRRALTDGHRVVLALGVDYFDVFGGDEAWLAEAWRECRTEILRAWLRWPKTPPLPADTPEWIRVADRKGQPGTRPTFWWTFDSPAPRLEVDRWYPYEGAPGAALLRGREPEVEFLARHNLLTEAERAALASDAGADPAN